MRYTGQTCPICHAVFAEDDDVVVCPECGTPHHRKCYLNNKDCANAALHTGGFTWTPSVGETQTETAEPVTHPAPVPNTAQHDGHRIVFCPQCGAQNAAEEPVCTQCGTRLYNTQNQPYSPQIQLPDMTARPFYAHGTVIAPTDTIDGNTVGDTAEYVRTSAERYIPKFYRLDKSDKKLSWNWAAFFFSPCWFFYRKLYAVGGILLALLLVITGATMTPRYIQATLDYQTVVLQAAEDGKPFWKRSMPAHPNMRHCNSFPKRKSATMPLYFCICFRVLPPTIYIKRKSAKTFSTCAHKNRPPRNTDFCCFAAAAHRSPWA